MKYLKKNIGAVISLFSFTIIGFFAGYYGLKYINSFTFFGYDNLLIKIGISIIILYVAAGLQILLHEAGHLVAGLISGYRFSSFRVGNIVFIKQHGKMKIRKLTIAGTGGQCLLIPPEYNNGNYPYVLYNLGGTIANLLTGIVFFIMTHFTENNLIYTFCILSGVCGIVFAILNGVPMHAGAIDNDGANLKAIGKSREAGFFFWLQLEINGLIAQGKRLSEMPEQWFQMPEKESLENSMGAVIGVLIENRLMDKGDFAGARNVIHTLSEKDIAIIPLHQMILKCDEVCCELLLNDGEINKPEFTKKEKDLMKKMNRFPSVIRTRYIITLLGDRDMKKAEKIKEQFNKYTKNYPNSSEIEGERELLERAEKKYKDFNCMDV